MAKQVDVKQYERANGVVVRSHPRKIADVFRRNPTKKDRQAQMATLEELAAAESPVVERSYREVAGAQIPVVEAGTPAPPSVSFHGKNLSDVNLSGLDLRGADFSGATFVRVNFAGSDLRDANFDKVEGVGRSRTDYWKPTGCDFTGAQLDGSSWNEIRIHLARGSTMNLAGVKNLSGTLHGFRPNDFDPEGPNTVVQGLRQAQVSQLRLYDVEMSGQDLSGLDLGKVDFVECIAQGVNLRGTTIGEIHSTDLSGSDISHTTFTRSPLLSNLSDCNFTGSKYNSRREQMFSDINFSRANFQDSQLLGGGVSGCDFTDCNFQGATLGDMTLYISGNKERMTNFSGVSWGGCSVADMNFNYEYYGHHNSGDLNLKYGPIYGSVAVYDRVPFDSAIEKLGLSKKQFEFLVISGVFEIRDNNTLQVVTNNYDPQKHHIAPWSFHKSTLSPQEP